MVSATYIRGNWRLFKFYLKHISTIRSLPPWMRNPDTLRDTIEEKVGSVGKHFELNVTSDTGKHYNDEYDKMRSDMRKLHSGGENEICSYKFTLLLLFCIRIACIASAWNGNNVMTTIIIASLQFIVAPYSFFVSVALAIALAPPIYLSHYVAFNLIQSILLILCYTLPAPILSLLGQIEPYFKLPIGPVFTAGFLIVDQATCYYIHYYTPSKKYGLRETMTHVVWGFLNTKTYTIVILLHMMNSGISIPIWIWCIDGYFKITPLLAEKVSQIGMHWLELFYHQHRMAHLPKVYEHAHKLHHYLHGTISFDAHIYGNGMPEEFFFMILELLAGTIYGQIPATLNCNILQYTLDNKLGHTQKPHDTRGDNFHADHHIYHVKNFGIYNCLMDMYFLTGTNNDNYMIKPTLYYTDDTETIFNVEKRDNGNVTTFYFSPKVSTM